MMRLVSRGCHFARRRWRGLRGPAMRLDGLRKRVGNQLICPLYHTVRHDTPVWWTSRYRIKSSEEFAEDMDWWLRWSRPVSLDEILAWRCGNAPKPEGFYLSFDDGYREMAEVIAPILKAKGIPATFFITSAFIDNRSIFFEDHLGLIAADLSQASAAVRREVGRIAGPGGIDELRGLRNPQDPRIEELSRLLEIDVPGWLGREQPYLTGGMIERMIDDGFSIGSHSVDHPVFQSLAESAQEEQIRRSTSDIVDRFALEYRVFAFPYGEFGVPRDLPSRLSNEGVIDAFFGTRGLDADPREPAVIQRLWCEGHEVSLEQHVKQALVRAWTCK